MHEHFYSVAYTVYENGIPKSQRSCLIRSARVPNLDAAKAHIRTHFLKDSSAVIAINYVTSISQEIYLKLGGNPNAPLLNMDNY